ncbi:hypothetical protein D3C75_597540 [compost metagenome]
MAAFAAGFFVGIGFRGVFHDACPCIHGIVMLKQCSLPQPPQLPSHIGIFHPERAVFIPGEGGPSGTAPGFKLRHIGTAGRIVNLLVLPGDDPVLHKNLPAARTRTIDSVRSADYFIMRPALAVHVLPIPVLFLQNGPVPGIAFDRFKKVETVFFLHCLRTLLCRMKDMEESHSLFIRIISLWRSGA